MDGALAIAGRHAGRGGFDDGHERVSAQTDRGTRGPQAHARQPYTFDRCPQSEPWQSRLRYEATKAKKVAAETESRDRRDMPNWTEERIRTRATRLSDLAIKVWPALDRAS